MIEFEVWIPFIAGVLFVSLIIIINYLRDILEELKKVKNHE